MRVVSLLLYDHLSKNVLSFNSFNSFIQSLFPYYKKTQYIQILTQQQKNNIWRSNQKANEARKRLPLWNKNSYIT